MIEPIGVSASKSFHRIEAPIFNLNGSRNLRRTECKSVVKRLEETAGHAFINIDAKQSERCE
jgi:hypothetical protein